MSEDKSIPSDLPIDQIIHGNTLSVLNTLPSESVDCVITSPPYWGLRSYSTNGQIWGGLVDCEHEWGNELPARGKSNWDTFDEHRKYPHNGGPMSDTKANAGVDVKHGAYCQICNAWRGELGLEPTFQLYIEHLQTIFDEVYRVLKKTGTCWVDMGDTYSNANNDTAPTKSLCNIPHRFAISMTDHKWIQRNTIIWHKPSCMPSSAKDRFTVDFEYVFLFSKNKKYYFEQQFEAQTEKPSIGVDYRKRGAIDKPHKWDNESVKTAAMVKNLNHTKHNPLGRNKRTVWRINPQPFREAHFAVFPEKLVEPMIKAGCPSLVCSDCGEPQHIIKDTGIVLDNESKTKPKNTMQTVRKNDQRIRPVVRCAPLLQSEMSVEVDSETPLNNEGVCSVSEGVYTNTDAGTSTGGEVWVCDGASVSNGESVRAVSRTERSSTSYKRDTGRQQNRKFDGDKKGGSRQTIKTADKTNYMPALPQTDKSIGPCQKCGGTEFRSGLVLDCFVGSGTTALVARKLGMHYIGIDLNEDYVTMANKRLSEVL